MFYISHFCTYNVLIITNIFFVFLFIRMIVIPEYFKCCNTNIFLTPLFYNRAASDIKSLPTHTTTFQFKPLNRAQRL